MEISSQNTRPLLVLNASAGSGKTYRLVLEYLSLLFDAQGGAGKYRHLVAMTFTNKAAYEMKERILDALHDISTYKEGNEGTLRLMEKISESTGMPVHSFPTKASEILSEILHGYEDFLISTIDKFNLRLIRSFHRDLNLPQEFEVVMNESEIMEKVVDAMLVKIGTPGNESLTKLVENYSKKNLEEETQWNFRQQLISFCSILSKERYFGLVKQLLENHYSEQDLHHALLEQRRLLHTLTAKCKEVYELFVNASVPLEKLPQKGKTQRAFENLANVTEWPTSLITPLIIKTLNEGKYSQVFSPTLLTAFEELINYHSGQTENYFKLQYYHETFYNLALLQYVAREMAHVRQEEQFVRISEFNALIGELVQDQHAPFIYERLGNRIHHFMLDEFQDTSRLQWMNLIPLVEESLSKGNKNLIVGDAKQSIYRFNNGLAEQFVALPGIYNPENNGELARKSAYFKEQGTLEQMTRNFRSGKSIVAFNNGFFETLRDELPESGIEFYQTVEQQAMKSFEGYVEILSEPKKTSEVDVFAEILLQIQRCLEDGFKPGDICILNEKNHQGNEIAQYLMHNNYKVVSSDSLLIDADQRIRLILSYLKIRNKNSNRQELMKFAELYLRLLHEDSELKYLNLFTIDPRTSRRKFSTETFISTYFHKPSTFYFNYSSLYELIQKLYAMLGWKEMQDLYLHHFCDIAYHFQQGKRVDLNSFLEYYEKNKHKLAIHFPKTDDAIQIMTIHKSKGLQFPVVIIPSADFRINDTQSYYLIPGSDQVFYRKLSKNSPIEAIRSFTLAENDQYEMDKVNLLYVAFTRPIHRLYVFNVFENYGKTVHETLCDTYPNSLSDATFRLTLGEETAVDIPAKPFEYYSPDDITDFLWHPKLALRQDFESEDVRMGTLFHQLISECAHSLEVESHLVKLQMEDQITLEVSDKLRKMACELLEDTLYNQWMNSSLKIRNEAWLMGPDYRMMRPDKIIECPNETIVIDFKTGNPTERNKQQVSSYKEAVTRCYGESTTVSAYLYYTQTKEWVSC